MNKKKIVIWGASGHASVVADIIRSRNEYEIVGYLDDINTDNYGKKYRDAPVLGGKEQLTGLREEGVTYLICGFGDNEQRLLSADEARARGFTLATAVHPRTIIAADVIIGPGTVVAAGAIINSGARIGENVIINTGSLVDHDCLIEDGVHISPGACLAGKVTVKRAAWIGAGATVIDGVSIGEGTIIGAGAVVVKDIPGRVVAYGIPARIIRKVERDDT